MNIKNNYLIEKNNILNDINANSMKLQELRFFSIYLARINCRDINSRAVKFPIEDFQKIMDLGRLNMDHLKTITNRLLSKIVTLVKPNGGYTSFQVFKRCRVYENENGKWYIEIDAHDDALPLMFEFKEKYFTYELWNALRLKSSNQLRLYEILKQYEYIGERTIDIDELKNLIGIETFKYPRYGNFKIWVLDACQKALSANTDIKFAYEPIKNKGKAGKVKAIKFIISKNTGYKDPLLLSEFIDEKEVADILANNEIDDILANNEIANTLSMDKIVINDRSDRKEVMAKTPKIAKKEAPKKAQKRPLDETTKEPSYFESRTYPLLTEACQSEFNMYELQVLYNLLIRIVPYTAVLGTLSYELKIYDHLKKKYDEFIRRTMRKDLAQVKSRFGYMKKLLEAELELLTF